MKRISIVLLAATLIALVSGPVLAGHRPPAVRRVAAGHSAPQTREPAGAGTTVINLPLVMRFHTPNYVSPFGVAFYYGINDAQGLSHIEAVGARTTST